MSTRELFYGALRYKLIGPFLTICVTFFLLCYLHFAYAPSVTQPGSLFGPASWPEMAFGGAGIAAIVLLCIRLREANMWRRSTQVYTDVRVPSHQGLDTKVALSGLLIVLYASSMQTIGFAITTALFLALWQRLHGRKRLLGIAAVSIMGTVVLLYMFAKFAYMPLPLGAGVFHRATVTLYRALGLF